MTVTAYQIGYSLGRTVEDQAHGSTLVDGRWHTQRIGSRPRRVIYAASSRALAQLEKRVHANGVTPVNQTLFSLRFGETVRIADPQSLLVDWQGDMTISQAFGNAWLDACAELALWVPSFVEPAENNILINPDHPDLGKVMLAIDRDPFVFDPRLMG